MSTHNEQGLRLYNQGRYQEALELFKLALFEDPENHIYNINVGNSLINLKIFDEAIPYLKKATEIKPDEQAAYISLGNAYFELEVFIRAAESYEKAVEIKPDHLTYNSLGLSYFKLFDFEKALKHFGKALELNPGNQQYISNIAAARESKQNAENNNSQKEIRSIILNEIANSYSKNGAYQQAIDAMKEAIVILPDNTVFLNNIAVFYYNDLKYKDALDILKRIEKIQPENDVNINFMGLCFSAIQEYEKAVRCFQRAIDLNGNSENYRNNLDAAIKNNDIAQKQGGKAVNEVRELNEKGNTHFNRGEYSEALGYFLKASQIDPQDPILLLNVVNTLYLQKNYETAILHALIGTKYFKEFIQFHNLLGNSYRAKKDYKSAIETYEKALIIKPEAETYNELGNCHFLQFEYNLAAQNFQKAVQLEPGIQVYRNNLQLAEKNRDMNVSVDMSTAREVAELNEKGLSFFNQNRFDEAIELFLKALQLNPNDPLINHNLGTGYYSNKDFNKAIEFHQKAVALDPENSMYLTSLANTYLENGDLQNAELTYQNAVKINPNDAIAIKSLGYCFYTRNEYKNAITQYEKSLKITPEDHTSFNYLGYCYHKLYDFEKAVSNFQKALDLDPQNSIYQKNLQAAQADYDVFHNVFSELSNLVGLGKIKEDIKALIKYVRVEKMRKDQGLTQNPISLHTVFYGPPGTGKTTIARMLGKIFKAIGVLTSGHLIETDRSGLVAEYIGQTGPKTNAVINSALNGVLFIDEAYSLYNSENQKDFGSEAIATLLKRMEDDRKQLIVIVAGYEKPMDEFLKVNPGLSSRFQRSFYFEDYKPAELLDIFKAICTKNKFVLLPEAEQKLKDYFEHAYRIRDEHFGNGRFVRNTFENIIKAQAVRISDLSELTAQSFTTIELSDVEEALSGIYTEQKIDTIESVLTDLDGLVGLQNIKDEINGLINYIKVEQMRREKGLSTSKPSLHYIFQGSPGTGKTTVARLLGRIFKTLGVLGKGHVVEVDRSNLVGSHIGSTSPKCNKVIDEALHGILFIDEAYTLSSNNEQDFGNEAIATLLKRMEDDRDKLMIIAAGYEQDMKKFVGSNPGLQSRFTRYLTFENYKPSELYEILMNLCHSNNFKVTPQAKHILRTFYEIYFGDIQDDFGNGRFIRNMFDRIVNVQANRVSQLINVDEEILMTINEEDISGILDDFKPKPPPDTRKPIGF